jgi:hypothetical protein
MPQPWRSLGEEPAELLLDQQQNSRRDRQIGLLGRRLAAVLGLEERTRRPERQNMKQLGKAPRPLRAPKAPESQRPILLSGRFWHGFLALLWEEHLGNTAVHIGENSPEYGAYLR